jgi:hypothetical protein
LEKTPARKKRSKKWAKQASPVAQPADVPAIFSKGDKGREMGRSSRTHIAD